MIDHTTGLHVELLEQRDLLSSVQIFAAGATGHEKLDLFVDNAYVQSFQNVEGDFGSRDFQVLNYVSEQTLTANQISIGFGNDVFDPNTGYDQNLYVDKIVIDGVAYETEDTSTSSTGIWHDGFTGPGNFQTEVFNINAIFQYSSDATNQKTLIEIDTLGRTGEETAEVSVNGSFVGRITFEQAGQRTIAAFSVEENIQIDDVRVSFVNDLYQPETGFDRNLEVYSIKTTDLETGQFQFALSSDGNVYSTGTYRISDGVGEGFARGSWLYANGFIEVRNSRASGEIVLDESFGVGGEVIGAPTENLTVDSAGRVLAHAAAEISILKVDGQLDTSFGADGTVDLISLIGDDIGYVAGTTNLQITDLDFFDDGSVLVTGYFDADVNSPEPSISGNGIVDIRPVLVKLSPDGSLDPSFATQGILNGTAIALPNRTVVGDVLATIASDGSVYVAGKASPVVGSFFPDRETDFVVAKLTPNGLADTSFGDSGSTLVPGRRVQPLAFIRGFVNVPGDRVGLITASPGFDGTRIIQLNSDGSLDSSFGNNGVYENTTNRVQSADYVALDSQGRYILDGGNFEFTRVNADGTDDLSFGDNGVAKFQFAYPLGETQRSRGLVLDSQDRIIAVATASIPFGVIFSDPAAIESRGTVVVRINSDGSPDSGLSGDSFDLLPIGAGGQNVAEVALDPSGKLLLAGGRLESTDDLVGQDTIARVQFV